MISWISKHKAQAIVVSIFFVVGFIILLAIVGITPYLEGIVPILMVIEIILLLISIGIHFRDIIVRPSEGPQRTIEPQPEPLTQKRRSVRKAISNYLGQLIEGHKYFTFLGRAKPLDLEKIYIALKVGEYVPRQLEPDGSVQAAGDESPDQRSGTVEVSEALRLHRRLVVLV